MEPPIFERYSNYIVAREDLIAGGTKYRALVEWLPTLNATHFSYTGSVFGYGAYALARACQDLGYQYTLYIGKNKYSPPWTDKIDVTWCEPAPLTSLKERIIEDYPDACYLEAGFPEEGFKRALIDVFRVNQPKAQRVWCSVVSGTMTNAMAHAWPDIEIHAVCCAKHHGKLPENVTTYYAPEKYHQGARVLPPYPAAIHTEAKIWQFVTEHGQEDDVIWNLAG